MLTAEPVARCGASKPCVDAYDREILGMVGDSFTFLKKIAFISGGQISRGKMLKRRVYLKDDVRPCMRGPSGTVS